MVAEQQAQSTDSRRPGSVGLGRLTVSGYKSIFEPVTVRIAPLTVLAGVNSSGKSSIMQPLLLLKQTLEATYDPGPLLLRGPNVQFSSVDQVFSRISRRRRSDRLSVAFSTSEGTGLRTNIGRSSSGELDVLESEWQLDIEQNEGIFVSLDMSTEEIEHNLPKFMREMKSTRRGRRNSSMSWVLERRRCFLEPTLVMDSGNTWS